MTWCFADESDPRARIVLERLNEWEAIVPAIWPLEIANTLLVAERRKRIDSACVARFLTILRALPISVENPTALNIIDDIMALGREHGLSAYDAVYIELAMREGIPIASLDTKLLDVAQKVGVDIFS